MGCKKLDLWEDMMDDRFRRKRPVAGGLCASAVALTLANPSLAAQEADTDTQAEAAPDFAVEEIVVTARRREESLQDIPISVTAFSGEALLEMGAPDITHLNRSVPNVTLERARSTNTTLTAFIRGVGQQDPVAGFEQGVGVYIDGVYLNRPQGAVLDVYDVERIEVLRGPQGTLYGRNTIGGAVKYVTKRLAEEPTAKVRVAGGTYRQADIFASVSAPLGGGLKVGGSIARMTRNGFGDNIVQQGVENYNKDVLAGRVSLEWTPSPDLFVRLAGDWVDDESDARNGHRLLTATFPDGRTFEPLEDEFDTRANLDFPESETVNRGASLTIEWDVTDRLLIKNITAYRDNRSDQQIDFDSLPVSDLEAPFSLEDDQFSQEIQINYRDPIVDAIAGFYYLDANAFNAFDVFLTETAQLIGLPDLNAFTFGDVDTKTWALFGDVTVDLAEMFDLRGPGLEGLELGFGGRYTEDERTARVVRTTLLGKSTFFGGAFDPFANPTTDVTANETFRDFTPSVTLTYKPNADHTLFASYSVGFKGGGFDPRGAPDVNGDGTVTDEEIDNFLQFEPETLTSYEVGAKSSWFNRRLSTSLAVFYNDYEDVQIPGSVGVDADGDGNAETFAGVTTNAGEARFIGVEFEADALLARNVMNSGADLSATTAVGYIDADFQEFIVDGENIADQRSIQNTPPWTVNQSLTLSRPAAFFAVDGTLSLTQTFSYRGETNQFEFDSPIDEDGYFLYDVSVNWTSESGRYRVSVHGRNLTDSRYIVAGYDFVNIPTPLGLSGNLTAFFGAPRTVTGEVEIRF